MLVALLAWVAVGSTLGPVAEGAERQFLVILATSPKHYAYLGQSTGAPPGGFINPVLIDRQYFDKVNASIGSFAEYWEEISYGDVTITGATTDWIALPWAFEPRNSTHTVPFHNLNGGGYTYGVPEGFSNVVSMVVVDSNGDAPGPASSPGFAARSSGGQNARNPVWTPGERFVDMDGDGRWDGFDECTNWGDWNGNGAPDNTGPWYDLNEDNVPLNPQNCVYLPDSDNDYNPDCCPDGPGKPGCAGYDFSSTQDNTKVCPATTWTSRSGQTISDCDGNLLDDATEIAGNAALDRLPYEVSGTQCVAGRGDGILDKCQYQSVVPCVADEPDPESPCASYPMCVALTTPRTPRPRCEYHDANGTGTFDCPEPFENFLRRWDPCLFDPDASVTTNWVKVYDPNSATAGRNPPALNTRNSGAGCYPAYDYSYDYGDPVYIQVHYPSDPTVVMGQTSLTLLYGAHDPLGKLAPGECRCADGTACDSNGACLAGYFMKYDSPDYWSDGGSTKMIAEGMVLATPEPGAFPPHVAAGEQPWFTDAWGHRYAQGGTASIPPLWPQGWNPMGSPPPGFPHSGAPVYNAPAFVEYYPQAGPAPDRRYFQANAGGTSGLGSGWWGTGNAGVVFDLGLSNLMDRRILPEERNGIDAPIFFDGWVEHDDVPSSKYHLKGDERLGEVTSPWSDAIWGHDRGQHNPSIPDPTFGYGDQITVAGGPYATNTHGEFGRDAGNVVMFEMLTWHWYKQSRDDGPTFGYAWEEDHGIYHPYAGPGVFMMPNENLGFLDYNLDGLLDQGEVRVAGSENYIVDLNPLTANDGTNSLYPWNRRRLMEDCIAVLDEVISFNDFLDGNAKAAHECSHGALYKLLPRALGGGAGYPEGVCSAIVLLPANAYPNFRAAFAEQPVQQPPEPGLNSTTYFYPINNEDNDDPNKAYPLGATTHVNWNIFFSDVVTCLDVEGNGLGGVSVPSSDIFRDSLRLKTAYAAHDYLHIWEGFPDLYDYDIFQSPGVPINTPIGQWDIMAGQDDGPVPLNLVHSIPILKEKPCTEWIHPIDLTTVLTPGVNTSVTLPPSERVRDNSYLFLENEARRGERYYLYSAAGNTITPNFDQPLFPGFSNATLPRDGMPATGMLMLHTDVDANPDALPRQQRTGTHFTYQIVEADGLGELAAGIPPYGNAGDPWPGSTFNTTFDFNTIPASRWYTQNAFTGLKILNIVPDGAGSILLTLNWTPTNIPSFSFVQPPGGSSVTVAGPPAAEIYQIRAQATDLYGGSWIRLFHTSSEGNVAVDGAGANFINIVKKTNPGTLSLSGDWNILNIPDGRYFVLAQLVPGPGANGTEAVATTPRPGRNNAGNGTLTVDAVKNPVYRAHGVLGDFRTSTMFIARTANGTAVALSALGVAVGDQLCASGFADRKPVLRTITQLRVESMPPPDGNVEVAILNQPIAQTTPATVTSWLVTSADSAARFETWSATCLNAAGTQWKVFSSLTQPAPAEGAPNQDPYPHAVTGVQYTSLNQAVKFTITTGSTPFTLGDTFAFTTTGISDVSRAVTIRNGKISAGPTAVISATPLTGQAPLAVDFDGRQSYDPNGTALQYRWDFGDGSATVTGPSTTSHTYQSFGTYTARLRVTDPNSGLFDEASVDVIVVNNSPNAVVSAEPTSGPLVLQVNFSGLQSSDVETPKDQLIFQWDFGDGSTANDAGVAGLSFAAVSHSYTKAGNFTAALTVTDSGGKKGTATITILAGNTNPVPKVFHTGLSGPHPWQVVFNARQSYDADGDALTVEWNWGDGTANETYPATTGKPGAGGDGSVPHTYQLPSGQTQATFKTKATVRDSRGGTATWAGVTVTVYQEVAGSSTPTAVFTIQPDPPIVNEEFVADGHLSYDRPAGDVITSYSWNFGDGSAVVTTTNPVVTYTYTKAGTYAISLTVADGETPPNTNTARLTVTVAGDGGTEPPIPGENGAPAARVLVVPTAGVAGETVFSFDASASTDADGDDLTFEWTFGDGTIASGAVVTHVFEEPGTYTVRVRVRDPYNASAVASQVITVRAVGENSPPVAHIATGPRSTTAGSNLTFNGSSSYDPDGDFLSYKWEFKLNGVLLATAADKVVTQPFAAAGTYTVELTVSDPFGATDTAGPETVLVGERPVTPGNTNTNDNEPEPGRPTDSAGQRPTGTLCGLGMIMGLGGSLLGLFVMAASRRQWRV